jgi:hypothetical protein
MKLMSPNIFLCNFQILFQVHVIQFGVTFDMHAEIYLICKNSKTISYF